MPDEEIIIVDADDNIIGHKRRGATNQLDIYRVSALWLTNSHGQILIAKRKLSKDINPGKWGPAAAGTAKRGETYDDTIRRETNEEIGVSGITFKLGPKQYGVNDWHRFFCQWYTATLDWPLEKFTIQEEEVEAIAWTNRAKIIRDSAAYANKYTPGTMGWVRSKL